MLCMKTRQKKKRERRCVPVVHLSLCRLTPCGHEATGQVVRERTVAQQTAPVRAQPPGTRKRRERRLRCSASSQGTHRVDARLAIDEHDERVGLVRHGGDELELARVERLPLPSRVHAPPPLLRHRPHLPAPLAPAATSVHCARAFPSFPHGSVPRAHADRPPSPTPPGGVASDVSRLLEAGLSRLGVPAFSA